MFEDDNAASLGADDAYPDTWVHCRRKKLLPALKDEPYHGRRHVEIDVIVTTPRLWKTHEERLDGGWGEETIDGFVFAGETIG